ncbi:T/G mismatch-specific endonuclease [Geodermatophilus telluris]|uniref:T/G mismatch-specific endonuclease n=1 Tax=Geodermatophilus telluris TaxID=1190417 RepID=A0A1G6INM7_9ACTN|nr:T/G mismatch-specific endonuclease [Geodermatophilus telluris]
MGAGLLTRDQLRSSAWRRLRQDVYADAASPVDHRLLARGVSLVMPRPAALGGLTAAALWGAAALARAEDPVEVVVPPGVRWTPGPGVVVRSAPLDGDVVRDGPWLRWTGRVRTAVDLVRRDGTDEAVVLLDRLVWARVVGLAAVRSAVDALPRRRGSAHARRAAALADGLAESPPETRLRLLLHRSGLPLPVAQYEVRSVGEFVARVDFARPGHRLAVEYDGAWHGAPGQLGRDRRRLNGLTAAGWRVVFVTAADLARPGGRGRPRHPGARAVRPQAPKSLVHQGPREPSATPTPSFVSEQFTMLARCPALPIHAAITAAASLCPWAMFSARA